MTTDVTFRGSTRVAHELWILGVAATTAIAWAASRDVVGWGWLFASALFTVVVIASLHKLRSRYLRLDDSGFETGARYLDTLRVSWGEVDNVELVEMDEGPAKGREAIRIIYSTPSRNELVIEDEFSAPLQEILKIVNEEWLLSRSSGRKPPASSR